MNEYSVETRDGCTLVTGAMPITQFSALAKAAGKKAVMSPHLAQLAGATFAWGTKEAVDALVGKLLATRGAQVAHLPDIDRWIATGRRGMSSNAIAQHLTGRELTDDPTAHPDDPDDLDRCLQLLEAVPSLRADLHRMAEVSPEWAALVGKWDEIEASHLREVGLRWTKARTAPKTYALMREALDGAREEATGSVRTPQVNSPAG